MGFLKIPNMKEWIYKSCKTFTTEMSEEILQRNDQILGEMAPLLVSLTLVLG